MAKSFKHQRNIDKNQDFKTQFPTLQDAITAMETAIDSATSLEQLKTIQKTINRKLIKAIFALRKES